MQRPEVGSRVGSLQPMSPNTDCVKSRVSTAARPLMSNRVYVFGNSPLRDTLSVPVCLLLLLAMSVSSAAGLYPADDGRFTGFPSRRSVVHSAKGIMSTISPLANEAGLKILRAGGNAAVCLLPDHLMAPNPDTLSRMLL